MKIGRILAAILAAMLLTVAPTDTALAIGTVTATDGDSYIRTGPGLGYATLGVLYEGESAEYLDDTQYDWRGVAWYCIALEGSMGVGWISSRYTELYEDGGSYWGQCVEATGRVNVRSGPGLDYEDMGTLVEGERIEYLDETQYDSRGVAWYKAMFFSNGIGWVSSKYSKLVYGDPSGDTGDPTYPDNKVKATGNLNIRSGPGLGYLDKGTMIKGDVAEYLNDYEIDERGVIWYKVRFGTKIGWVSSRYSELY